jgi:Na+-transporting NADH:ubiquinone oxidoreductase subunit NqrB
VAAPAIAAPGGRAVTIRGHAYPILLPTIRDPRLHLAAVILSLQALGQIAFDFKVSIAQILISLATCAVIESGIAFFRQHLIMWPASALITGNGVSFILRVPGTEHGDWWSMNGWWIYVGTAAVSILSKHLIKLSGRHIFNPSNFGLVLCFLVLGESRAEPLDFWWGPMDAWMLVALAIIVGGGFAILTRLKLLHVAVAFWLTFAAGLGLLTVTGHAMSARWHIGPVTDAYFWWVLVTSPEILVFLFFMISDPKTIPASRRGRIAYAVAVGILATILIAASKTEFWAKVAVLGALTIVCLAWPLLKRYGPRLAVSPTRTKLAAAGVALLALWAAGIVTAGIRARPVQVAAPLRDTTHLPAIETGKSEGVSAELDNKLAQTIAADLVRDLRLTTKALATRNAKALEQSATFDRLPELRKQIRAARGRPIVVPAYRLDRMNVHLEQGNGQGAAIAVAALTGTKQLTTYDTSTPPKIIRRMSPAPYSETLELQVDSVRWLVARVRRPAPPKAGGGAPVDNAAAAAAFAGVQLTDLAGALGLDFRQGAFRFGVTADPPAYMGGGVCWLDYNNDGWLDLFAVNSYGEGDIGGYGDHQPQSVLYRNNQGLFKKVYSAPPTRGEGCVAGDLNGDGLTDLYVTSAQSDQLLWNNGDGTFTEGARAAGIASFGWHSGAAIGDVNGDGLPDLYVAGYTEPHGQIPGSSAGFPTNYLGVRDELFLNLGHKHFKEVGAQVGLDPKPYDHSLGAVFTDVNGDGRLDLYVANDEDPNRLYVNRLASPYGFRFVEQAKQMGVADPNAGMGIAAADYSGDGRQDFFVSNSRGQGHAAYRTNGTGYDDVRSTFNGAIGENETGWGDSWVDLNNDGRLDLVLANGNIPVRNLAKDAKPIQVLQNVPGGFVDASGLVGVDRLPLVNGRGIAAADFDNDGHVDLAVNSVGGKLMLLRATGGTGHWLEVQLPHFAPGALVTVTLPGGRKLVQEVHAGSSYLSSEDPRVHFGLGNATKVLTVKVRYPDGHASVMGQARDRIGIQADRVVTALP